MCCFFSHPLILYRCYWHIATVAPINFFLYTFFIHSLSSMHSITKIRNEFACSTKKTHYFGIWLISIARVSNIVWNISEHNLKLINALLNCIATIDLYIWISQLAHVKTFPCWIKRRKSAFVWRKWNNDRMVKWIFWSTNHISQAILFHQNKDIQSCFQMQAFLVKKKDEQKSVWKKYYVRNTTVSPHLQ